MLIVNALKSGWVMRKCIKVPGIDIVLQGYRLDYLKSRKILIFPKKMYQTNLKLNSIQSISVLIRMFNPFKKNGKTVI